jgi:hypothetical protein
MKARYRHNTIKEIRWANKKYKIGPDWVCINDIGLFEKLSRYPQDFDTVSFFDLRQLRAIKNLITIKDNLIFTSNKSAIKKISKIPFIIEQAKKETGEIVFRIFDYSESKLSSYQDYDHTVNVLVFRKLGGLGDIIMTFPVIEHAKKKNPNYKITYSCPKEFLCLAENNPYIDNLIPYSIEVTKKKFDIVIDLTTDCIKYEMKHQPDVKMNRSEIFMESAGFDPKETPRPKLYLNDLKPIDWWSESINDKIKIGLILESNANIRTWNHMREFASILQYRYRGSIVFFDICKNEPKNYKPLTDSISVFNQSLRDIMKILNQCDLVIGPDTGPMHMASALNIPTLWLFTHIDGSIRTKNYDSDITHFIQGGCNYNQ